MVKELRRALTVDDSRARLTAPDGMQLTLFTPAS